MGKRKGLLKSRKKNIQKSFKSTSSGKVCPLCNGRGVVLSKRTSHTPVEAVEPCVCRLREQLADRLESFWRGLSRVPKLDKPSVLMEYVDRSCRITAPESVMRSHLKSVLIRLLLSRGMSFSARIITDEDLVTAWLSTAAIILDLEVAENLPSLDYPTVKDLSLPPDLLVIRLGVKRARNEATPEVLLEALTQREHVNKVTWLWDQNDKLYQSGHIAFSSDVQNYVSIWPRKRLESVLTPSVGGQGSTAGRSGGGLSNRVGMSNLRQDGD